MSTTTLIKFTCAVISIGLIIWLVCAFSPIVERGQIWDRGDGWWGYEYSRILVKDGGAYDVYTVEWLRSDEKGENRESRMAGYWIRSNFVFSGIAICGDEAN